nr:glycoside hydrolase domain-containing protein [Neobacillus sp. Marseille-Q6967]
MNTGKLIWVLLLTAILVLPLVFVILNHNNAEKAAVPKPEPKTVSKLEPKEAGKAEETSNQPEQKPPAQEPPEIVWGVDSASPLDQAFLQCVKDNYGNPVAFGRYLETKEGVSSGLTPEEVNLLHQNGIKIIPIYNHFTNATTYENGVAEAKAAIAYAQEIGIPEGVAIFADIEPTYPVDEAFIRGWVETLLKSPYKPGIYGVFTNDSTLTAAFQAAVTNNQEVGNSTIIWSSNPDQGVTPQAEAPAFQPGAPQNISVTIWQYGIDGETCNIDTNLINSNVLDYFW